jgi:hypothetical protein
MGADMNKVMKAAMTTDRERFEKAFPHLNLRPSTYLTASGEEEYGAYETRLAYAVWCAAEAQYEGLLKAGRAVVERWETPSWKDAKPTAGFIYTMRDELDKLEGKK